MNTQGSIFYMHVAGRRFPVPLVALESYSINASTAESDEQLFDVLITTMSKYCNVTDPQDDDIEYFLSRLKEVREEIKDNDPEEKTKGKTFGTAYLEYISGLSIDAVLLRMVNYDINAAEKLYCTMDRTDVVALVDDYVKGRMEENLVNMEAAMYGFGGGYKSDKQSKGKSKGVPINSAEGMAQLAALGF